MLVLDGAQVRQLYPMERAITVMADAMRRYSAGQVSLPLRTILRPAGETGLMGTMPGYVSGESLAGFGLKAMMLKPENPARGLDLHIGVVLVFDKETARPLAMMDASAVTAIRTAAVTAVATDALARPDAGDLAILGSGVQARSHLESIRIVRVPHRVRVWSPNAAHVRDYVKWAWETCGIEVETPPSIEATLKGAEIICTTTSSKDPVVGAADLTPGAHVNAVGASFVDHRELGPEAVAAASVFVDSRESAASESGDLLGAINAGLVGSEHIQAELGEVLLGRHPGRRDAGEITLYKSLGLGVQDIMSGFAIAEAAAAQGIGLDFSLDNHR
ncbi:MAG TPA: ornithine cyclodeaminase family protein [Streptosporangiaceae bacterium]|nr:ornithine cyclodeaminase family protein [Streptosporangiaceae bacterium]